jgi:hypothetical protein
LREGIIKANVPFSVTRTPRANSESLKVDFAWEEGARSVWPKEFGFGTAVAQWRFVLFGPDELEPNAKVICGNEWQDSNITTKECTITKEQMAVPLSADIDVKFVGDPEDDFRFSRARGLFRAPGG